ncbi:histidinol dehydrogenase [Ameyamaea chiangmaiensis NBRC 103196]|uniref:Histidinol dehydrogenase n=1 Tax=Ameyamaea chiangmaiensis TaxID=442969 RepID=A0A850PEA1_9PROT|nr:histidinol dehydrogenase [Ameyamaea chiangmaiensis]MBS4076394.1 histidinol dehydrogenase [Ameyamaea chiangmaiensis]NVN40800.1 histidinol dehydrogenase [Ameyamaea chiangmaiensis]GBQ63462.1 histidinol dehydrogenase [Ameyamaea chiangmaiensis NBRC 103196]
MPHPVTFHDLTDVEGIPPALLRRTESDLSVFIERVKPIIDKVRTEGDAALRHFAQAFDNVSVPDMAIRATEEEFDDAFRAVDPEVVRSIEYGIANIRRFHEAQKPEDSWMVEVRPGLWAGDRCLPIESVACYVPRGKGAFPSVVNMTAIPGKVAGVPRLVIITPPAPDGRVDPGTLVAARLIGVDEVYKCGGAQGVAAVAYGTETVPACAKIVGPGSPYVVAAKRLLSDILDPGTPAGPSEAIILTDDSVDPEIAVLDLLIESEHGPDSSAWLVTSSRRVAEAAIEALPRHWAQMDDRRADFSRAVLGGAHGGVILTRDFDAAVAFTNAYAPEHLELLTSDPMADLGRIRNAGEVLLGTASPVTLCNYVLGPNAVLPTNRSARTHSPLSVHDYMKRMSFARVAPEAYPEAAAHAERFARYEGFTAHARAVSSARPMPTLVRR